MNFNDIRKGDRIRRTVREKDGTVRITEGTASRMYAGEFWETSGGCFLVARANDPEGALELIKPELPTKAGSIILVTQLDGFPDGISEPMFLYSNYEDDPKASAWRPTNGFLGNLGRDFVYPHEIRSWVPAKVVPENER